MGQPANSRQAPPCSLPMEFTKCPPDWRWLAIVYLYVEQIQKNKNTGAFILPMVVLLQLAASALLPHTNPTSPVSPLFESPLFGLHTVVAVLGYCALSVGAVYCVMFLLLYRALKARSFGLIFERLPSLDVLSNMAFGATFLGWIFLTVTILIGALMSMDLFPTFYEDPKFITTIAVWMVYGTAV